MPYTLKRLLMAIPTLIGVALFVFVMLRVVPGDIVELKFRAEGAAVTQQMLDTERKRLGLDKPIGEQFVDWMKGLATLDFGKSLWSGEPVIHEIGLRIGVSLQIAILATILAILISVPLGALAAVYRDTFLDHGIRILTVAGLAVPAFWAGMIIIIVLLTWFRWLPPITYIPIWKDPIGSLSQTLFPALAVGFRFSAMGTRMMRGTLVEVMEEDYVRTAKAKGLGPVEVVLRHAMRNALLPVVTIFALEFAFLMGGLVVTEQIFNINGIGQLFVQSVLRADYTVVQAIVMMLAFTFIVMNVVVDMLYSWMDPRIKYSR